MAQQTGRGEEICSTLSNELCAEIGTRIRRDILKEKRPEYGEEILPTLSAKSDSRFRQRFQ